MTDLYPTYRENLLDPRQEGILKAVMDEWKQSELKSDPVLMLQTLDAVDAIIRDTYDLPGSVRKAVERAKIRAEEERKKIEEEFNKWRWTAPPAPEPKDSQELTKVLKEMKSLKELLGLAPKAGTQKRKPRVTKKRAGSKTRTKAKS